MTFITVAKTEWCCDLDTCRVCQRQGVLCASISKGDSFYVCATCLREFATAIEAVAERSKRPPVMRTCSECDGRILSRAFEDAVRKNSTAGLGKVTLEQYEAYAIIQLLRRLLSVS